MNAKEILIWVLASSFLAPLCACKKTESTPASRATVTEIKTSPTTTVTERKVPDYMSQLQELLGVEPVPSTFNELKRLTQKRQEAGFKYEEDEEHHYCLLGYKGNPYYVIRYDMAQEWFEYFFDADEDLYFEEFNGYPIITAESFSGPEGMLMTQDFRVFVDDSCKFLVLAVNSYVPQSHIDSLFGYTEYVTVEDFKDYYSMNDSEIEDYLIEDYIWINRINKEELAKDDHRDLLEMYIKYGDYNELGYSISTNMKSFDMEYMLSLEEFINEAQWIYFEFEFPVPDSDETMTENMVFDIRHGKVYFNADTYDFRDAEMCADLDPDVYNMICEELPDNVGPDERNKYPDLEYTYLVYVINADGEYMRYTSFAGNSVNALFDEYWKSLYKMCYGEDHELNQDGFDPEQNKIRRLNHTSEPTLR